MHYRDDKVGEEMCALCAPRMQPIKFRLDKHCQFTNFLLKGPGTTEQENQDHQPIKFSLDKHCQPAPKHPYPFPVNCFV